MGETTLPRAGVGEVKMGRWVVWPRCVDGGCHLPHGKVGVDSFEGWKDEKGVVGSLRRHMEAWRVMGASNVVLDWVQNRINLVFLNQPASRYCKPNAPMSKEEMEFADGEVKGLLGRGGN